MSEVGKIWEQKRKEALEKGRAISHPASLSENSLYLFVITNSGEPLDCHKDSEPVEKS